MTTAKNKAWLLLGGNMGHREALLQQASALIESSCGKVVRQSGLYQTAAWGKRDQAPFLNQALEIETRKEAEELLECLLQTERLLGRERAEKYGPRLIDIDIIFFNNDVINLPHLVVPHPHLASRRFVLQPLAEIASQLMHPALHKTVQQLLDECSDPLAVERFS